MQQKLPLPLWQFCQQSVKNMGLLAQSRRCLIVGERREGLATLVPAPGQFRAQFRRDPRRMARMPLPVRPADCIYLGDFLDPLNAHHARSDAVGTYCMCEGRHRRACEIHGAVRVNDGRNGSKTCQGCNEYVSENAPPP